jgi:hypothetical protein
MLAFASVGVASSLIYRLIDDSSEEFIGAKKHLVLGVSPMLDNPKDENHLLLDNRHNGGSDYQAMVLPCRRE